jgi:hypothetical protein
MRERSTDPVLSARPDAARRSRRPHPDAHRTQPPSRNAVAAAALRDGRRTRGQHPCASRPPASRSPRTPVTHAHPVRIRPPHPSNRERPRHQSDDVVVFGDPFWDPLWDIDADLVLGYNPYAYPPRAWETYGPTGPARRNLVSVELHVQTWKASVIVDESTLGQARDYNDDSHPLFLTPGDHQVELQYPGYETLRFTLNVQRGLPRDLHYCHQGRRVIRDRWKR